MNALTQITELVTEPVFTGTAITIIYEDRVAGLRAKRFSDMIIDSLGWEGARTPACWRSELIAWPEIAERMMRDAVTSEFVILSLRGDTSLSMATKMWIESWLVAAAGGPACLVALFDPERSAVAHSESTRNYLRNATSSAGLAFFAHYAIAPTDGGIADRTEDEESRPMPARRRRARKLSISRYPVYAAA